MSDADRDVTPLSSSPGHSDESRGSSVSTQLREEYEDLLRYAVITPVITPAFYAKKQQQSLGGGGVRTSSSTSQQAGFSVPQQHSRRPLSSPQKPEVKAVIDLEASGQNSELSATPDEYLQEESSMASSTLPEPTAPPMPFVRPPSPFNPPLNTRNGLTTPTMSYDHPLLSHDLSTGFRKQSYDPMEMRVESDSENIQQMVLDPEIGRLGNRIDLWCLDLKRNLLAEFEQSRLRLIEAQHAQLRKEREQQAHEMNLLKEELERYKDLALTYEQSIGRKDHIIVNLTGALQKRKDKEDLQRTFGFWHQRHCEDKRENFCSVLADRHYCRNLKGRVMAAWLGTMRGSWKLKMECACQSKAQDVCVELTGQYEDQLAAVRTSLEESRIDCVRLKQERDLFEENMKKAFMRGVCALNLEAMTMFKTADNSDDHEVHGQPTVSPLATTNTNPYCSRDNHINANTTSTTNAMLGTHNHVSHAHGHTHMTSLACNGVGMATNVSSVPRSNLSNVGPSGIEQFVTKATKGPNVAGSKVRGGNERTGSRGFGKGASGGHVQRGVVKRPSVLVEKHAD